MAAGSLTPPGRQYKARGHDKPDDSRKQINERIQEIARKKGLTMAQVALAWSLANPYITAPIIGSTKLDNLKELLGEHTGSRRLPSHYLGLYG